MAVIGIDLGTTNSLAAYIEKWRKSISSLYRLISLEDRFDTDEVKISCFHP